jgi:hypothetical protein
MLVSTRMSATIPFVTAGHGGVGVCAEGRRQRRSCVGLRLQVRVERAANDLCHGHALRPGDLIDHPTLMVREVDLRSGGRHTARVYSTGRSDLRLVDVIRNAGSRSLPSKREPSDNALGRPVAVNLRRSTGDARLGGRRAVVDGEAGPVKLLDCRQGAGSEGPPVHARVEEVTGGHADMGTTPVGGVCAGCTTESHAHPGPVRGSAAPRRLMSLGHAVRRCRRSARQFAAWS